jgi:exonuclease SbcC
MRFERIRLKNFKPYGDADLRLTEGVTVIHGLNGSGKSSLLEACFFALYGSKALEGTLDEVVTNGEDETELTLWFAHDGVSYRVDRRLRAYDDRVDHDCTLEATDGAETTRDGATAVRRFVTELLRMDADAFVNCAYVRQGEVNALINATPSRRQDIIDDLLQLGVLEEYRERAGDARLGVEDVLNAKRAVLEEKESRIETKAEEDPHERLNGLESKLADVESTIDRYETQRERAKASRDEAAATLETHAEQRAELESIDEAIDAIESAIRETEREREEHREAIAEAREAIESATDELQVHLETAGLDEATDEAIAERRAELDERATTVRESLDESRVNAEAFRNQAANLTEKADDSAERAAEVTQAAAELEEAAEEAEAEAAARDERIAELRDEAEALRERFTATDVERDAVAEQLQTLRERRGTVREQIATHAADLENARERVAEAEALLDAGKCPTCGQSVDNAPHATGIADDRQRVAELSSTLEDARDREQELNEQIEQIETLVETASRLDTVDDHIKRLADEAESEREAAEKHRVSAEAKRERAAELKAEATDLRAVADDKHESAETAAERVSELESDREAIQASLEAVDAVEGARNHINELEATVERRREKRADLDAVNDERRDRLTDKRARRNELREAVNEEAIEAARERRAEAEAYLERVNEELDRLDDERSDLQSTIGSIRGEIEALETLREEQDALASTVASLESLHEEVADLESTYGDLRAELRQRNVRELERTLNETFELVYGNDAYSHIELDGQYALTVYQKDGEALDPDQLSGGERALFNLSLRCAIYRLLAEGIEGAAPTPPLILDEPTVFLDAGHVSRLVDLVEEMRGFGVRQIVIVSHDDELVGAADELVTVEKDPRTNRSTVTRAEAIGIEAASFADD